MTVKSNHEPEGPTQPVPPSTRGRQGIVLRTRYFRLDWTLRFTRPTVTVDGHSDRLSWGEHFFPLDVGRHELQVSYPYLRLSEAGKASAVFDVAPNQLVQASYRSPRSVLVAFLPGKLSVEPPAQS
jgi:hypothetical protein